MIRELATADGREGLGQSATPSPPGPEEMPKRRFSGLTLRLLVPISSWTWARALIRLTGQGATAMALNAQWGRDSAVPKSDDC
jgi:hypothetical protein